MPLPLGEIKTSIEEQAKTQATVKEALFNSINAKLGIAVTELETELAAKIATLKQTNPTLTDLQLQAKATDEVRLKYGEQTRSPAKLYEGFVFSTPTPYDIIGDMRDEAIQLFRTDKIKSIREGYTDAEGNPLDRRATFGTGKDNPDYGKKLKASQFLRNLIGIAVCGKEGPKEYSLTLRDEKAVQLGIPIFIPVKFRANFAKTQKDPNVWTLNQAVSTDFVPTTLPISVENIFESTLLDRHYSTLANLPAFYEASKADKQAIVITRVRVRYVDPEPNEKTKNCLVVVDDNTLPFDDAGIPCWIPVHLQGLLNFGPGSWIIVVGQVRQSTYNNQIRYMINTTGLYAIPNLRIPLDENPSNAVRKTPEAR